MMSCEEIHIWRCACPASADAIAEFEPTLSDDERRRAERFWSAEDRRRFITSRGALRRILAGYVDAPSEALKFQFGIFGKPRLDRSRFPALPFNVSRAGDRMIVAVGPDTKGEIGVDLVEIHPAAKGQPVSCRELLAGHFPRFARAEFSDRECERVFARLWSQSEAILKARGSGVSAIMLPLGLCDIGETLTAWRVLDDGPEPGRLIYELAALDGYAAALVVPGPMREIRVRNYDANFERPLKAGVLREQPVLVK